MKVKQQPYICAAHKQEGMVDVKNMNCCEEGCKTQPAYNNEGETIVLYNNCKSDWCLTVVQENYDGYCLYCYINLFPEIYY
jgi:hypothetical protein